MLTGMFLDPDEVIVVFLLFDSTHVLVKIVVDIFVAVAGIESLQEELVIIFPRKLL